MAELSHDDLHYVMARIPSDVRKMLHERPLFLGGGFIRSVISQETISDVDLFGETKGDLEAAARALNAERKGRLLATKNAYTVFAPPRWPVQFISRWLYNDPTLLRKSFDFSVCQAVVWYRDGNWHSDIADRFYQDLAAHRLYYTAPLRHEDAGGSLLRMRKFLARGYNIQIDSIAAVIARLMSGMPVDIPVPRTESDLAMMLMGLLTEVDPPAVIDGLEIASEARLVTDDGTDLQF